MGLAQEHNGVNHFSFHSFQSVIFKVGPGEGSARPPPAWGFSKDLQAEAAFRHFGGLFFLVQTAEIDPPKIGTLDPPPEGGLG